MVAETMQLYEQQKQLVERVREQWRATGLMTNRDLES